MRTFHFWVALVCVGAAMTACNSITGADDIHFSDDDDSSSASQGSGGIAQVGSSNGSGGSGSVTTNTSGSGGLGSGGQGSGGSPQPCVYPPGPYGVAMGQTVPPNLSWQGYLPGASSPSTITMESFFDCDGRYGINAVVVDTSQYG